MSKTLLTVTHKQCLSPSPEAGSDLPIRADHLGSHDGPTKRSNFRRGDGFLAAFSACKTRVLQTVLLFYTISIQ